MTTLLQGLGACLGKRFGILLLSAVLATLAGCASTPGSDADSAEDALVADYRNERALREQMLQTPQLAGEEITAQVVDGEAILSGTVRSSVEREIAEQVARSAAGITRVTNNLTTRN